MNNHLVKNHNKKTILNFGVMIIIFVVLIYFFPNIFKWYSLLVFAIIFIYNSLKKEILLEIILQKETVKIKSYTIINGNKELILNLNEIIELDIFSGFSIRYKNSLGKNNQPYIINAEPWNNIYTQIKNLKLALQEINK